MKKLIDDITGYTFTYRAGIPHRHQAVASAVRYDWSRPTLLEPQAKQIFHLMVGVEVQPMILEN
tara:strand:+ start:202 stop:393 length:192 start_codon:yes stop_codon:yes gene_type:complete